ncbi:MAG: ROK family protein [Bacillota bacterium]
MISNLGSLGHWVVGLDLGGTFVKGVLVDPAGQVRGEVQRNTPVADGPTQVARAVVQAIQDLKDQAPAGVSPDAVGLASPGAIDVRNGIVVDASNLGLKNVPLVRLVQEQCGLPVFLDHDVRTAAFGELVLGSAVGLGHVFFLTLGTGIGGAVIMNGRIYTGSHELAGEIGHMVLDPEGDLCACGKRGCLETYASASWVVRRVRELGGFGPELDGERVATLVEQGDPVATAVWQRAASALGLALANYTVLFDPDRIILGGGLSEAGELLLEPVRQAMRRHLDPCYSVSLTRGALGAAAGRLGAAVMAQRRLTADAVSA